MFESLFIYSIMDVRDVGIIMIKEVKEKAWKSTFKSYFKNMVVVFIALLVINGGYKYSTNNINNITNYSIGIIRNEKTNADIIRDFVKTIDEVNVKKEELQSKYSRGVLAVFFNEITASGSMIFGIINAINSFVFSGKISTFIIIVLGLIVSVLGFIFISNIIVIGLKRYFLEQRKYRNTNIDKIFYGFRKKYYFNIAYIMIKRFIYQMLWNLTIIGGFIKHYEYLMIPYILAENPKIKCKEAFILSKEMMNNHKLEAFKLDITLIPWKVIEALTLNISSIFFYNAYRECIRAEYYMRVRNLEYEKLTNKELLNDRILNIENEVNERYPEIKKKRFNIDYHKNYSLENYVLLFFSCAIIGWLWEVLVGLMDMGVFVNRGTMMGPWLPIYGWGAVAILIILKPCREKPWLLFLTSLILCGIIEYGTGWYLETFKQLKWWDYSGYFMNLHGRICLEGLIVFGASGVACTYLLAPILDNIFNMINLNIKRVLCIILVLLYVVDLCYSSKHPNTGYGVSSELRSYKIENVSGRK